MTAAKEDDVCSRMKVVVRVRPETQKEKQKKFSRVVHVIDQHVLVFDPKEEEEVCFFKWKRVIHRHITKRQRKDLTFMFDAIFDETSSQLEVFEHTTKTLIEDFLNGYNCTVLAYGATGAGKTHTMLGSPKDPGVMYLTMMTLYNRMDQIKEDKLCDVAVSYLEIYNEQIRDLLVSSGPLAVREDAQQGVTVQGLTLHQPKSAEEILQLLDYGNKNRTQHATRVNASSSRSHAVLQIYLRQQDETGSINQNVRVTKMCLIDLAGSERTGATSATGARFVEGTNINRSLLALGNVINALADPKRKKHIPYRNSRLTHLLKDSLGGNCRSIMIAAVSPSSLSYDDTCNTLRYASRAKDIKSSATCERDQRLAVLNIHSVQHMQKEKEEEIKHFEENTKWLHPVENEMRLLRRDESIPKELCPDLQCYHLNLEVQDLKTQMKHMVSLQDQYYKQTEEVLNTLLPVLRKQYLTLKEAGLTNDSTEAEFGEVEQFIQKQKSMACATHGAVPECNEGIRNSSVVLYEGADETTEVSTYSPGKESLPCSTGVVQRRDLSSSRNKNNASAFEKPSYMATTASAQPKRKVLLSSSSNTVPGGLQDPVPTKRPCEDFLLAQAALRVPLSSVTKMKSRKQEQDTQRNFFGSFFSRKCGIKGQNLKNLRLKP